MAGILSGVISVYWLPPCVFTHNPISMASRLTVFLIASFFLSWICYQQKRNQAALQQAREELEQRVQERTRELSVANEGLKAEIAERKRTEAMLDGQKHVLEMIAANAPLADSLAALVRLIEEQIPGMLGSILLIDREGRHLCHGAAPNLPPEYVKAIDGSAIGPVAGSCGTAAYREEPVIVKDIATDPLWKDYRDLALQHGLRACWSTPIFSAQRDLLGTFAMYYRQPALPDPGHYRLIEMTTHIASIVISCDRSQSELRESETKLKEAQRIGKIGYWERDLIHDRNTWSGETCRIFGQPPNFGSLNQIKLLELIHPDDRSRQAQALEEATRECQSYEVEYRIIRPDGETRFVHVRDEIVCDALGQPVRMFGTVQDITERKRAEELLKAREREIRAIVEHSPDPIVRFDRELHRTYVNPAFAKIYGIPREKLVGRSVGSVTKEGITNLTAEDIGLIERSLKTVFDTGQPLDFETSWPLREGRRSYAVHMEPEFDAHGQLTSVLAIARDITRRKQEEAAVRESQQLLQQVLATLPVGVLVTNQSGDNVLANAALKDIWGNTIIAGSERWSQSKGFRHDTGKKIAPADWASARALNKGETSVNELIDIETFDGRQKTILNSAAPLRDAKGRIVGAVVVNEDITEQKKGEEKLRQTELELARVARVTMLGELTTSIAHEVNQPLSAVVTNANAALRWLAGSPPNLDEARQAVQHIVRDGNRAGEVIRRVRELTKKSEPVRKPVNLNELIRETVSLTQPELKRKKVSLQLELSSDLPFVFADNVQLEQVLLNLIVNAADSLGTITNRPRLLHIRTEHLEPGAVQVAVQDNGVGVKPEESEHLFQPFYTTKSGGLGMGLAISRSIVEAHGGRLWAVPNTESGAVFQFTLPIQNGES